MALHSILIELNGPVATAYEFLNFIASIQLNFIAVIVVITSPRFIIELKFQNKNLVKLIN